MSETTPWAFIAHKDGYWAGVASSTLPKKDLREFLGDFAADGFSIMTVYSRDEYNAAFGTFKYWHERPEAKPHQADMFADKGAVG